MPVKKIIAKQPIGLSKHKQVVIKSMTAHAHKHKQHLLFMFVEQPHCHDAMNGLAVVPSLTMSEQTCHCKNTHTDTCTLHNVRPNTHHTETVHRQQHMHACPSEHHRMLHTGHVQLRADLTDISRPSPIQSFSSNC